MRFVVRVAESVEIDELEAASWYERKRAGLGYEFRDDVKKALDKLAHEALLHPLRCRDTRRAGLERFSDYGRFYFVRRQEVIVFALIHGARNPSLVRRRRGLLD